MIKSIKIFMVVCITSMFFFPFFFSFIPFANTKMIVAVFGLVAFALDKMRGETNNFESGLWSISLWALGVSFCSFLTMTINNTPDDSYLGYIISMLVWLFAAYFCVYLMKNVIGYISVEIVGYFLLGVALLQCVIAVMIDVLPFMKVLFDTYITGARYMGVGVTNRLYGVGCALDVGGGRLGAVLIIIIYLIMNSIKLNKSKWLVTFLVSSFIFITIIGNMMGRTTSVGVVIALLYLLVSVLYNKIGKDIYKPYFYTALKVLLIGIVTCIILYNINAEVRKLLRFAFEGFFNYFEYGKFETNSTNMLSQGMIFPDNLRDWILGHGYMASGTNDPYYLGPSDYGFYMNTDAGYSRFIFYFGLIGMSTFIMFFVDVCRVCIKKMENFKFLFIALLLMNLAVWVKVSTDLFVVFAPFLCVAIEEKEDNCISA